MYFYFIKIHTHNGIHCTINKYIYIYITNISNKTTCSNSIKPCKPDEGHYDER